VLAIAIGITLVAIPIGYSFFDRTADAERILDRFEFLTRGANPARYLAEAELTRAGSTELVEEALPALGSQADVDITRFRALVAARQAIPSARRFSSRYSEQLDAVDEKFASVYDIPVAGLPLTTTPWLFLAGGLAFVIAGLGTLRSTGWGPLAAIALLGAVALLAPVALGALGKSADAEDVKDFASRGLTPRAASAAQRASSTLDALVSQTRSDLLPLVARRRRMTEAQLNDEVTRRYPTAAAFLAQWPPIGPRLSRLADAVSASTREFASVKRMPIAFPVFVLLGAGLLAAGSAGTALFVERRRGAGRDR